MEPIKYAMDAQGVIYIGNRVIARDNPDNPQSAADIARLVFRANAAGELLAAIRAIAAETTGFDTEDMIANIQGICRAAIAKAEGDAPPIAQQALTQGGAA